MYFGRDDSGKKIYLKLKELDCSGKNIRYLDLAKVKSSYER